MKIVSAVPFSAAVKTLASLLTFPIIKNKKKEQWFSRLSAVPFCEGARFSAAKTTLVRYPLLRGPGLVRVKKTIVRHPLVRGPHFSAVKGVMEARGREKGHFFIAFFPTVAIKNDAAYCHLHPTEKEKENTVTQQNPTDQF